VTETTSDISATAAADAVALAGAPPRKAGSRLIKLGVALVVLALFLYVGRHFLDDLPKLRRAQPPGVVLIALI
jgi:hypothetical protein